MNYIQPTGYEAKSWEKLYQDILRAALAEAGPTPRLMKPKVGGYCWKAYRHK